MEKNNRIFEIIDKTEKTLVFTSETSARNALHSFIISYQGKAVFSDRFLSWDKFSLSLSDIKGKRPATGAERRIFISSILKKEGREKLKHFLPSLYPESTVPFISYISKLLPFFPSPLKEEWVSLPDGIKDDIAFIRPKYEEYLEENGLYEERYLEKDLSRIEEGKYVFVYPETFTSTFSETVVKSGKVEVISSPENKHPLPLHEYKNSISEIRGILRLIENDRKQYKDSEIAITSSSLDTYRPYLEEEAKKRDIPLIFTSQSPLSSYPEGKIMKVFFSLVKSNWNLREVKKLFLEPAFPFKEREALITIVRVAIDYKIQGKSYKEWIKTLDYAEKRGKYPLIGEAKNLFSSLYKSISLIVKSNDSSETERRIREFRDTFLSPGAWNEENDRILGSILEILENMKGGTQDELYRIFLSILDDTRYVEKNENSTGIKVYSYPSSAGLIIPRHYIIGLDDKTTALTLDDYPFLKEGSKPQPKELGKSILSLYSNPIFTEFSYLSGTTDGFDGSRLLPTSFLDNSSPVTEILPDAYSEEIRIMDGKGGRGILPEEIQKKSRERALRTVLKKRDDVVAVSNLTRERRECSVSAFNSWDKCPYKGYAQTILKLQKKEYETEMEDVFEKGNILHRSIQLSLEEKGNFQEIDGETIKKNLSFTIEESKKAFRIPDEAAEYHIYRGLLSSLEKLPEAKGIDSFSSGNLVKNELSIKDLKLDENVYLSGRLDTVLRDEGGKWYILDYKLNGTDNWSSSNLNDMSLQVILYYKLLKAPDSKWELEEEKPLHFSAAAGGFYSNLKKQFLLVWSESDDKGFTLEEVEENADERIKNILENMKAGTVSPQPDDETCAHCDYRRLCRGRFVAK